METVRKPFDTQSRQTSSSAWSERLAMMRLGRISKQRSAWDLPPFYDLENLHGILGPQNPTASTSPVNMSSSNQMGR
jgi:hypothetical protein